MKHALTLVIALIFAAPAIAENGVSENPDPLFVDGTSVDLNDFLWINRPVVVLADSPFDPRFVQQMELLNGASQQILLLQLFHQDVLMA